MLARPPGSLITARPVGLVQTGASGFPEFIVLGARPPDSKLAEEEDTHTHTHAYVQTYMHTCIHTYILRSFLTDLSASGGPVVSLPWARGAPGAVARTPGNDAGLYPYKP